MVTGHVDWGPEAPPDVRRFEVIEMRNPENQRDVTSWHKDDELVKVGFRKETPPIVMTNRELRQLKGNPERRENLLGFEYVRAEPKLVAYGSMNVYDIGGDAYIRDPTGKRYVRDESRDHLIKK